ncbi:MAG: TatD family hydrolase [Gemmatimonadales bacterium]
MPSLVDSHCHLADEAFAEDRDAVLARAWERGVGHVVVIGETPDRARAAIDLAHGEQRLSATAGLHPHEARHWDDRLAEELELLARDDRVVAVGETGLDYHYDHSPRELQRAVFDRQLELAARVGKPAVIHAREADDDVIAALEAHPDTRAVLHSFSSGSALLEAGIALGHYVSFSGMLTFKSFRRDDEIRRVPPDRLLVETDAPYLAPVPERGHRNEPAFVAHTLSKLAAILGLAVDEAASLTTTNAARLFGPRVAATTMTPSERSVP